jgi:DNA-binding NarL/FixJ family response regulator
LALSVDILNASPGRRRRIASLLGSDGIEALDEAVDARDGVDAVVADLPADSGTGSLRTIVDQAGGKPVVAISAASDRRAISLALAAGADGIVLGDDLEALPAAVRGVCAGQLSLPRSARHIVFRPGLSTREKQILGMVVLGLSNGEIAAQLSLAESTVKSHLSSAFSKLGVRSRNEATAMILDPDTGLGTGILAISEEHERLGPADPAR